jgi:hypothetical protein
MALPMTAGVPQPLADVLSGMCTPVKGNDANFVDHLLENRHISRTLQNQEIIVVAARKLGSASGQTTLC